MRTAHTFADLAGQRFGRLTVIRTYQKIVNQIEGRRVTLCDCLCDCQREHTARAQALKSGGIESCGCLRDDLLAEKRAAKMSLRTADASL